MTDKRNLEADLDDESDRLRRHSRILEDLMDPDYGLLDQLLEMGALSRREIHDVKSERTFEKRNTQIVDYVSQYKRFGKLILALRNTNQKHLANYLTSDGVYQSEFGDEWPLTELQTATLNRNQLALIDCLDDIDFLSLKMYSADIINNRHRETIYSLPTNHEKSEVLLDIMVRHSQANFSRTIEYLEESNHRVVEILRSQGVVIPFIAKFDTSDTENISNVDKEISTRTNNLLRYQSPPEDVEAISELKGHGLIGTKDGHSVAFYFNCKSSKELSNLWTLKESGRLKDLVEMYVNRLLSTEHQYKVRLQKWSADDYAVKQSILNEDDPSPPPKAKTDDPSPPPKAKTDVPSPSPQTVKVASTPIVGTLQVHGRVYGVTKLNGLIYVLGRSPNAVYVFSDEHPFKQMPEVILQTPLKFEGYDISACSISSCLYVSDSCSGRVFKIPVDDPSQMTSWLQDVLYPPWTLSVCGTGDVLIARNEEPLGLELYSAKAEKIYSVRLAADAFTLRHAVSTSDGGFIVIHKWKDSGGWGLSEVNGKGETVHCFKQKQKSKSLGNPCHLALDHDDRLIVLDQMKKEVVRFDRDLNWQDILVNKDQLEQPLRLCYDKDKRQLIVGQENGSVGIYSI